MTHVTVHQITSQSVSKPTGDSYFNVCETYGKVIAWSWVNFSPTVLTSSKGCIQLIQFDTQADMREFFNQQPNDYDVVIILNDSDKVSVVDMPIPFKFLKELT